MTAVLTRRHSSSPVNSSARIDAFNPDNGELLWYTGEDNRVPVPTPVYHDGVLYASRGYNSGPYFAQKPGGKLLWEVKTGAPYVSSLLYYEGLLYMATETGIVTCVDAADGKTLWKDRFGGVFSASPIAADGKVYLINEAGEFWVLAAGREKKIVHQASLGERTLASPAISRGTIFVRTDENLIAIGR
jgi:outer membrane protein assembly factor BamB